MAFVFSSFLFGDSSLFRLFSEFLLFLMLLLLDIIFVLHCLVVCTTVYIYKMRSELNITLNANISFKLFVNVRFVVYFALLCLARLGWFGLLWYVWFGLAFFFVFTTVLALTILFVFFCCCCHSPFSTEILPSARDPKSLTMCVFTFKAITCKFHLKYTHSLIHKWLK